MREALFLAICLLFLGCASGLTTVEKRQRSFSSYETIRAGELRLSEFLALRTAFVLSGDDIAGSAAIDKRGYFITASHCLTMDTVSLLRPTWRDGDSEIRFDRSGVCRLVWRGDHAKGEPDFAILALGSPTDHAFEWTEQISLGIGVVGAGLDVDISDGKPTQVKFAWFGGKIVGLESHASIPLIWKSILHSGPMHAGDSGGPIATQEGRLIGVSVKYGGWMLFFRGLKREPMSLAVRPDLNWLRQVVEADVALQSQTPNKVPEPTPGPVTSRADDRVAPAPVVAHL
jgi:hypothetical protein